MMEIFEVYEPINFIGNDKQIEEFKENFTFLPISSTAKVLVVPTIKYYMREEYKYITYLSLHRFMTKGNKVLTDKEFYPLRKLLCSDNPSIIELALLQIEKYDYAKSDRLIAILDEVGNNYPIYHYTNNIMLKYLLSNNLVNSIYTYTSEKTEIYNKFILDNKLELH